MPDSGGTVTRRRRFAYVALFVVLFFAYLYLRDSTWRGDIALHTLMEAVATVLALAVGSLALVRYYSKKDNTFLFIGTGFVATAFLDGYHTVVSSSHFIDIFPSTPPSLIAWSWFAARIFLSLLLWMSWLYWRREDRLGAAGRISEKLVYSIVTALALVCFAIVAFVPMPAAYYQQLPFPRPQEFLPALFFLLALIGYLRKGKWKTDVFEHWLVLSLIVGFMGQAMFMSFSGRVFDMMFDAAHLLKNGSYICAMLGLLFSMRRLFSESYAQQELQLKNTILATQLEVSPDAILVVDEHGKIISYNRNFVELWGLTQEMVAARDDEVMLHSVVSQMRDPETFLARVDYLYQHRSKDSGDEIDLRDGRIIDRFSAPMIGEYGKYYGRVWFFRDITERKQAELKLLESERRFSDLLGNVELISMMLDREAQITYCNDYLLRLTGWQRKEVIGKSWWELFVPPEIQDLSGAFFTSLLDNQPEALHHENEIVTRSGERRFIRWNNSVLRSAAGEVIGTASIGEDITEQTRSEASIKYLNRVLSVLSGINTLIVRVNHREELFREACNIAVKAGGFRVAMIVTIDPDTMQPVSVISEGKNDELLTTIKDVMSSSEGMQTTLVAQAMREKKALIVNDTQSDPGLLFGKKYTEAGVKSLAIIPLIISGETVGALALYASEIEFFQEDEMKLLAELAGDIAYAIDHIDKQEQLNYLAYYDVLTGLANHSLFLDRAAQYIHSAISGGHKLAIGMIDLERFKNINDSLGRPAGDSLLKQVAVWLTQFTQDANLLARIDADHFAFVVPEIKTDGTQAILIENLMAAFQEHAFDLNDATFRIGIKVGIAVFPDDGDNADTLYINAEAALKKTRLSGERYLFYTQKMTEAVAEKLGLENQLRRAIDNEEFVLHYQPKVNLVSGKVTGAEALIRWNDPRTGLVPPGMFIPVLEETGLIYEVGRWALRQSVSDWLRWRNAGLPAVRIAVNVSPLQLRNTNFINEIRQVVSLDAHAAYGLELEITESLIMEDVQFSIDTLKSIRAMGITFAIDDFGTGFSSLSYLAKLPVDTLKIDRAFVIEMDTPEGQALVSTIINLAHALNLRVVAEGVETEQQMRQLLSLNCDEMQGFLFSKPVPADIFEARFLAPLAPDDRE